jgi:hypothetical protein
MKARFGPPPHVDVARLSGFLVDGVALTSVERGHIIQCQMCTQLMRIAASDELKRRRDRPFPVQVEVEKQAC